MKTFKTQNSQVQMGIVTKKQAEKAIAKVNRTRPARKAFGLPTRPGLTVPLNSGVSLTKISTPTKTIKSRWVLVGMRHAIKEYSDKALT